MKLTGNRCQCAACGELFSRTSLFDRHRTGDFGRGRRCMTEVEMLDKGWRLIHGVWHGKPGAHQWGKAA